MARGSYSIVPQRDHPAARSRCQNLELTRHRGCITQMRGNLSVRKASFVMTSLAASLLVSFIAQAQKAGLAASEPPLSAGFGFTEKSGEQLFSGVCQGCHMSDGKGATGAGTYPSLAGNKDLEASGYPIGVVINGQRGMPPF